MTGHDLPRLHTAIPGPKSRRLARELQRVESRNVTYVDRRWPIFWERALRTGATQRPSLHVGSTAIHDYICLLLASFSNACRRAVNSPGPESTARFCDGNCSLGLRARRVTRLNEASLSSLKSSV